MVRRERFALLAVAAVLTAAVAGGCRDQLAAPTHGFIEVRTGGVEEVQVFIDGEVFGTLGTAAIGPLPAGMHRVTVSRECYEASPAEVLVEVRPARTSVAEFVLEPREFGSVTISATDEMSAANGQPGFEITGAEILIEEGGSFVPTGLTTPALVDSLPCGTETFLLRAAGYAERRFDVRIDTGVSTEARVELGPFRKVLAEMFTYVICPNCPEAADSLQALDATLPGRVHIIEWHTWVQLPLGDPRWKAREDAYTGGVAVGWPAVVFQGGYADDPVLLLGSQNAELVQYRTRTNAYLAECEADCDYALEAEGPIAAGSTDITARVKWRGGPARGDLRLRFVLIEGEVDAPGNDSPYHFVPRNYHEEPVSFSSPGEILEITASLAVDPAWDPSHLDWVAYLQSDATLEILAVDGTP